MRAAVVPDWLTELMRPKPAPLPWPDMIRAALAICVPLAVGFAALHAVSKAASAGTPLPAHLELPDDETLEPITGAVRALLGVRASGERLTSPG